MASVNPSNNTTAATNNGGRPTQTRRIVLNLNDLPGGNYSLSNSTINTLARIMENRRNRAAQGRRSRSVRSFHDNTSPGYQWLLPGWLAEEHKMPQGRVYRYYFDPSGNVYRSQEEVLMNWEMSGLVVIDN